jgi:hypothetical protein
VTFQEAYENLILLWFTGKNMEKNASIQVYQANLQLECQGEHMRLERSATHKFNNMISDRYIINRLFQTAV